MKDDLEVPLTIPRKRRHLERAPDLFLAVWASRDETADWERQRVQAERDRRKKLKPSVKVAVLIGGEGLTPAQRGRFAGLLIEMEPTTLYLVPDALTHVRKLVAGIPSHVSDFHAAIRDASLVLAFPKDHREPIGKAGVWLGVRYARHRNIPLKVFLPNGDELPPTK